MQPPSARCSEQINREAFPDLSYSGSTSSSQTMRVPGRTFALFSLLVLLSYAASSSASVLALRQVNTAGTPFPCPLEPFPETAACCQGPLCIAEPTFVDPLEPPPITSVPATESGTIGVESNTPTLTSPSPPATTSAFSVPGTPISGDALPRGTRSASIYLGLAVGVAYFGLGMSF
ncbi:hypothetical protein C8F01DRAFT_1228905 [Mycena amicta]|nr:hypothetical protein C8F01DRAFT_1228905 [Mycena amicta]